ncbi:helix-turn-helix domain-containing protein (plasmid) [Rathayibacter sp. VKM Ac-2760]|nr:helix-turn-helix domain-containing protein [Rathayibacter sp. VKM Ac-2760]
MPTPGGSQTLDRGVSILELLAEAPAGLTIDEVARHLTVHRSIAYRLLRTLEDHRLIVRDSQGRIVLGPRMAALAAGVSSDLQASSLPELRAVAQELGMTCFLTVLDADECVTLVSVEARSTIAASVAQRPGARHAITVGAPGKAILSALPESEWPEGISPELRAEIHAIALRGFATSHDEVIATVQAVSVPLVTRRLQPAALAVMYVGATRDPAVLANRLLVAAAAIRVALDG